VVFVHIGPYAQQQRSGQQHGRRVEGVLQRRYLGFQRRQGGPALHAAAGVKSGTSRPDRSHGRYTHGLPQGAGDGHETGDDSQLGARSASHSHRPISSPTTPATDDSIGLVPMDTFLVNLSDQDGERFMKLTLRLSVADAGETVTLMEQVSVSNLP